MASETPPEALERLRKLLRLAKSDNPNEAAVAAAAAQRLMTRYAIDSALLDSEAKAEPEPETFVHRQVYRAGSSLATWVLDLCSAVVTANKLRGYFTSCRGFSSYTVVGPESDCALAAETVGWLVREVERLYREDHARDGARGRAYWSSWRQGCASMIGERVRSAAERAREERRRELTGPSPADYQAVADNVEALLALDRAAAQPRYALAAVETALAKLDTRPERIQHYLKSTMKLVSGRSRERGSNYSGFAAGRAAGKRANLK